MPPNPFHATFRAERPPPARARVPSGRWWEGGSAAPPVLTAAACLALAGCGDGTTAVPAVATVTVTPAEVALDLGASRQLSAEARDASGALLDVGVTWVSAAPAMVSVGLSGRVIALEPGVVQVTATAGGRSGSAWVTSRDPDPPPAPTGVQATPVSDRAIDVSWTDGSDRETEFRVQRANAGTARAAAARLRGDAGEAAASDAQPFVTVGTVEADVTTFRDEGLQPGAVYLHRVLACNENGCSAPSAPSGETRSFPTLDIETAELPPALLATPYAVSLEASGPDGVEWSLAGGALPPGLTLTPAGGVSGIPGAEGEFGFTVRAVAAGQVSTRDLSLAVVRLRIMTADLPDARTGEFYQAGLEAGGAEGAEGAAVWSVEDGALPAGVALEETTGVLAGTPTEPGAFPFTVGLARGGAVATAELVLVVDRLVVTAGPPPAGAVDMAYAAAFGAEGGDGSYAWDRVAGALPPGLLLAPDGTLAGVPERAGTFPFTVRVRSGDGQESEAAVSVRVDPSPVGITTTFLTLGTLGTPYTRTLQVTGGDGIDYAWSVVAGALPPGVGLHPVSGVLSGTPTQPGTFDFTVRVASGGSSDTQDLSILVSVPPVVIGDHHLSGGYLGVPYDEVLEVSGGDGSYAFSIVGGALPAGLSLDPATGAVTGTPTEAGARYVTFRVDSHGNADARTFLVTVSAAAPDAFNLSAMTVSGATVPAAAVTDALGDALARWEEVIVGDLPPATYAGDTWGSECEGHAWKLNGSTVDDMVVLVDIRPLDGVGGILGSAGPCAVRPGGPPWLTAFGLVVLDAADLAALDDQALRALIVHEIGHVVGIGTLWEYRGNALVSGADGPDPRYVGSSAVGEYVGTYGGPDPDIAVANTGGQGTRDVHWRESVFDHELMTGYAEAPGTSEPLSRMSVGSVGDLGYTVDLAAGENYELPPCAPACTPPPAPSGAPPEGRHPMDRVLDEPVWVPVTGGVRTLGPGRNPDRAPTPVGPRGTGPSGG